MGHFRFKPLFPKAIEQFKDRIIGGCTLLVPAEKYLDVEDKKIVVLVRLVNYQNRHVQLIIVHNRRREEEEFSRIMMQLLYFLMTGV